MDIAPWNGQNEAPTRLRLIVDSGINVAAMVGGDVMLKGKTSGNKRGRLAYGSPPKSKHKMSSRLENQYI